MIVSSSATITDTLKKNTECKIVWKMLFFWELCPITACVSNFE